jgi:endoglucanase
MKNKITFLPQLFTRGFFISFIAFGLLMTETVKAQLPTAQQIAGKMKIGWNLGNTLEAICGENAWGAGHTSQRLIDSVRAAGFNSVRVPVAWFCHSDTVTNQINAAWIARVKEVVDYCIKDSLYVFINIHWDNGWLENHITIADSARVNARQRAYWTQIANYFRDYDEHLLFASANEPNAHDATGMSVLLSYHQTFVDAVRATGGNNSSRTLVVQGPSTDIDLTNKLMSTLPADQIADRLMVEVHYYTPWNFCGMNGDQSWGKMFYYWGQGNHSTTDVTRNATWGEESDMDKYLGLMKTKFIDKGIPVLIGEYGAFRRKLSLPSDQALHNASIDYFYRYFMKSATGKGIKTFCWDTPGWMFNRSTGVILDRSTVNAIMQGSKDVTTGIAVSKVDDIELYPNPFTSSITLKINNPDEILSVVVCDTLGKQVETIEKSSLKSTLVIGSSLDSGMYLVKVFRPNRTESYKVVKK